MEKEKRTMMKKMLVGMLITCSFMLAACGIKENTENDIKVTEAPLVTQEIIVEEESETTVTPPLTTKKELPKLTATPAPAYHPFDGDISDYVYYYQDERNKAWEEDIIYIANKFIVQHPLLTDVKYSGGVSWLKNSNLEKESCAYNEESRKNFLQQINELILGVSELDDTEVIYELQKIIAALKDGHSFLYPVSTEAFPIYYAPLMVEEEYRLYVSAAPKEYEEIIFSYLESINGA